MTSTSVRQALDEALGHERDIRELAVLDPDLLDRVRSCIKARGNTIEAEVLLDGLEDLAALRIHKLIGLATQYFGDTCPPDLEGATAPETELYHAIVAALQRCVEQLCMPQGGA